VDSDTGIQFVASSTDYFVILAAVECAKCICELVHIGKLALGSGSGTGICWGVVAPCEEEKGTVSFAHSSEKFKLALNKLRILSKLNLLIIN
jgi:hypothetical protein